MGSPVRYIYIYVPTDVTAAHAKVNYYAPGVRAANRNLIGKMKNRAREGKSSAARENSRFSFGERINRCVRARARSNCSTSAFLFDYT